ncbi:MAG: translation initiation factor IF-2 [Alphaproteobacteria bacterium]|nr:MAG: translation initiation factor IF-2 [Alphaproteobacteria bacterium]
MAEDQNNDQDVNKPAGAKIVRQSLSYGKSKNVAVEIRRKKKPGGKIPLKRDVGNLTSAEMDERLAAVKKAMDNDVLAQKPSFVPPIQPVISVSEVEPKAAPQKSENTPAPEALDTERKRKADFSKKDKEKKAKAFVDDAFADSKKERQDKRSTKRVDLTYFKDVQNIEEAAEEGFDRQTRFRKKPKFKKPMISASKEQEFIVREVVIPQTITVSELANRMAIRVGEVIKKFMKQDMFVTANQPVDGDLAEIICTEFGHTPKRVSEDDVEKLLVQDKSDIQQEERAPVVTVMGHVDHGKTSLLDALRKTSVVKGEAGGITQHVGAYRVFTKSKKAIVFVDTPGHAAFSSMRARGANITDIVILVVAVNDGVKDQTVEAIHHAKAAKVPIIVAINKMDLPDANPSRVIGELVQYDVIPESMGGDVMITEISAKTGQGLDNLEESILLLAETLELKAPVNQPAAGVVVEATQEKGRGNVATILVQSGTLRVGDVFVVGRTHGKVKLMLDETANTVKEALPSTPVRILGLNEIPDAGDALNVVGDEQTAISIAKSREQRYRNEQEVKRLKAKGTGLEGLLQNVADSELKMLPIIIKGDVHGSVEAIKQSLEKLSNDEVRVNVLHTSVGEISESDVTLAQASNALIVAFNVRANSKARVLAKQEDIRVFYHSIIYKVIEDIENIIKGLAEPTFRDKFIGYAEIRQVFSVKKFGKIAGCMVTEGIVQRGAKVRLLRDNVVIHEGKLKTLKRFKDEVKEVKHGYECGMAFENYDDIKEGDVIECSVEEEVKG